MNWREVPDRILIGPPGREEVWTVRWRRVDDPEFARYRAWGTTDGVNNIIDLDERLKHDPSQLADTWTHELMHASCRYVKLPKVFDAKLEERLIEGVSPILSRALAQRKDTP